MADPNAVERMRLVKLGYAMPDGSYYIRAGVVGASDLQNAIDAVGRGQEDSHNAIRVHIMKRAKALGLSDKIPGDWQADGSLTQGANLKHFGITGMKWGQHQPGTEAVGGKGNPDGAQGPSPTAGIPTGKGGPAAFIQRGDHSGGNSGNSSGPSGSPSQNNSNPDQQANASVDFLKNLRDHTAQAAQDAAAAAAAGNTPAHGLTGSTPAGGSPKAQNPALPPAPPVKARPKPSATLSKQQASAVHQAAKNHATNIAQIHNKAKAAQATHAKTKARLKTHPHKAQAKRAVAAAAKQHAAHMAHLKQVAQAAHAAHQAHIAKLKAKGKPRVGVQPNHGHLSPQDKAALKQLSPTQRSALKKIPPNLRAHAGKLTQKQMNNMRLTPAERASLSKLSPKQKAALAKATAQSAVNRHNAALAKKTGNPLVAATRKSLAANKSVAAAKKQTAAAQAHRTASQKAAITRLRLNAQNGTRHDAVDGDVIGTFLEHDGVKPAGTADIVARLIKMMKEQPDDQAGQDVIAIGRKYVQGCVSHEDEVSAFLEHHGVKGMKWGVRRNGGHPGTASHPVSADAEKAHVIARTIHEHGTAAVGNEDLQHLVNRQRLIQQHAQLNPEAQSNYRKGLDFVKTVSNDTKTVLDAVSTGQRVFKTIQGLNTETPPRRQSRRTRNKALKVVDIKAA